MPTKWTAAQEAAINIHGCDLLICAAAGSGKTAALTERIIRSLTREDNPADITRILAVTFTRAAAAELRRRISAALYARLADNPGNTHLIRQLMLIGSAKICTIDSFYNDIVKSNFQRLSLPAGFRIADDAELTLLEKSVMEELIDRSYADADAGFLKIADNFSGNRDDTALPDFFIDLYETVRKYPEGVSYLRCGADLLRKEAEDDFFLSRAGKIISSALISELEYYSEILDRACGKFKDDDNLSAAYYEAFAADKDCITSLCSALNAKDYNAVRGIIMSYTPLRLKSLKAAFKTPESDALKQKRDDIKKRLAEIRDRYFKRAGEDIPASFTATAEMCEHLYDFISQFESSLRSEKLNRGICDFEDIRRYTLELLIDKEGNPTDIARSWGSRFDEILIDEYQDVDAVQDMIFRSLSGTSHRFMVGDIKQSIYGFRGAEPTLFSAYRSAFPAWSGEGYETGERGTSVFMSENFRCDKSIVRFVNLICPKILAACGDSVGYVPQDDLIFSKATPAESYISPPVSVTLIHKSAGVGNEDESGDRTSEETESSSEADTAVEAPELRFIAAEVSRLLREEHRADGSPLRPGDIAVLCRTKRTCRAVADALGSIGIPTVSDSPSDYMSDPDVSLMISLLTVIDNPQKDIPLAAVLRSPFFGFTLDELTQIRLEAGKSLSLIDAVELAAAGVSDYSGKCRRFCERLEAYRVLSRSLPADRLIRHIMRDTSVFSLCGDTDVSRERLLSLYEYARQFEAGSFRGLYNFIKYINNTIESNEVIGPEGAEPGADAVTVITIHHSKGLEFPVCFISGCGLDFNSKRDAKKDFLPNRAAGPASRIKDATGLAKISTQIIRASLLDIEQKQTEEEMRLLYVAMTRARERLYLTARYRFNIDKKLADAMFRRESTGTYPVLSAKCYLDWLLLSLGEGSPAGAPYKFDIITDNDVPVPVSLAPGNQPEVSASDNTSTADDVSRLQKLLDERFAYTYPYKHLTQIPAKLSVSHLYPSILDENETGNANMSTEGNDSELEETGTPEIMPAFLSEEAPPAGSAERGTATHVFLQFCDFERCESQGVQGELALLSEKRFISQRVAQLVDIGQIEAFFASEFYSALKKARWMRREQRFNILLPASDFSQNPCFSATLKDETLLVQGVIDLFFEDNDGKLILCDYKTDRLTPTELSNPSLAAKKLGERHLTQLSYYSAALCRICGKAPDRVLIYSLPLGDTVDINI